jgi:hypothetical protein
MELEHELSKAINNLKNCGLEDLGGRTNISLGSGCDLFMKYVTRAFNLEFMVSNITITATNDIAIITINVSTITTYNITIVTKENIVNTITGNIIIKTTYDNWSLLKYHYHHH